MLLIVCMPTQDIILVMCGGKIVAHDTKTLVKKVKMEELKSVLLFAVNQKVKQGRAKLLRCMSIVAALICRFTFVQTLQLCITVKGKRKLQLYEYLPHEESFRFTKELGTRMRRTFYCTVYKCTVYPIRVSE